MLSVALSYTMTYIITAGIAVIQRLFGDHRRVFVSDVYLSTDEVSIATALNNTVTHYPAVSIGSYPHLMHRLVFCFSSLLKATFPVLHF